MPFCVKPTKFIEAIYFLIKLFFDMTTFLQKTTVLGAILGLMLTFNACGSKKTTTTTASKPTTTKPQTTTQPTETVVEEKLLEARVLFFSDDMEAAFARAKAEKKPIFLDFWATWCQPCRVMDESVFRDWDVADYLNANVVNIKVDVDKNNGKALTLEYGVKPLPSYIFLDPNGKVISKHEGTITIADFKKLMKTAFWKTRNPNG
jgi:thiol:disulfide interchange protein